MPNIWFTADFHLGHKNIIRYCNRPFDTVEEMNRTIIERLNSLVKTNDILYFLGDFCIGPKARAVELHREIRCKKIFAVPGNHDKDTRKLTQEFSWLGDLVEVSINGQRIVLCHYAMRVWNHSSHGAWHLYGHSHGRLPSLDASRLAKEIGIPRQTLYRWIDESERIDMDEGGVCVPLIKDRESRLRKRIGHLKQVLANKTLEVDFFKGALRKVRAQHHRSSDGGEPPSTTTSGM